MRRLVLAVAVVALAFTTSADAKWLPSTYTDDPGHMVMGISFPDTLHGLAVGSQNRIFYTNDGARTVSPYVNRESLPSAWFYDVYAPDLQKAIIVGSSARPGGPGTILRSTDYWRTWQEMSHPATNNDWRRITAIGGTLWIGGGENTYPDSSTGLVAKSMDFGTTWKLSRLPQFGSVIGIVAISESRLLLYGTDGTLALSTDGGQMWRQVVDLNTKWWVDNVVFADQNVGYASVTADIPSVRLYATNDGGETWQEKHYFKNLLESPVLYIVGSPTNHVIYMSGLVENDGISYRYGLQRSFDNGLTWTVEALTGWAPIDIYIPDESHGWMGTDNGLYYRVPDDSPQPTAIDEEVKGVPAKFALEQNYPNPFNPSTTIGYSLPEAGLVRLVVYDALGQVVAVLVNGRQEAGTHHVVFNAAGLPSGAYIFRLTAGEAVETKKMVLLK